MRIALYLLFLLTLFSAAAAMHHRWLRENRRVTSANLLSTSTVPAEGWARLVVGRPSGVEPVVWTAPEWDEDSYADEGSEEWFDEVSYDDGSLPAHLALEAESQGTIVYDLQPEPDIELTLDEGQTLSEICHELYGTASPKVYGRVAEYNGLPSADAIRAGQALKLPPRLELLMD